MDNNKTLYFLTGSQHLYGEETLRSVAEHAQSIVSALNSANPVSIVWKPTVKTASEITDAILAANADKNCVGIITWMHTFSPAKMWIQGLKKLQKPMLHLHTQFNRELPFESIDMDFMNLNQSAHGDREFGYICTRLNLPRKVVAGHWSDGDVQKEIADWSRVALAWDDAQTLRVARIGDNMRNVAVTEGNKVDAEITLGYSVNGYGICDVAEFIASVKDSDIKSLMEEYDQLYTVKGDVKSIYEAARQELGIKAFLDSVGAKAFTTTFEDLHGMHQLMGFASQRLMSQGYGFGAEGDWKTAALLRTMKVMAEGVGGVSFMEDYTYDLTSGNERVLSAHMLEVCPSIASGKPVLDVHPLGIGGKANPARLIFNGKPGLALNASLVEFGEDFRLIINRVESVKSPELPKLPVASVLLKPLPDFKTAVKEWIKAGGAHHTCYTQSVSAEQLCDYAEIAGIETVIID